MYTYSFWMSEAGPETTDDIFNYMKMHSLLVNDARWMDGRCWEGVFPNLAEMSSSLRDLSIRYPDILFAMWLKDYGQCESSVLYAYKGKTEHDYPEIHYYPPSDELLDGYSGELPD